MQTPVYAIKVNGKIYTDCLSYTSARLMSNFIPNSEVVWVKSVNAGTYLA